MRLLSYGQNDALKTASRSQCFLQEYFAHQYRSAAPSLPGGRLPFLKYCGTDLPVRSLTSALYYEKSSFRRRLP